VNRYEQALRNAGRRGVPLDVVAEAVQQHRITPESFKILDPLEEIKDPHGKSFFLIPAATSGDCAREAALMTYILNAGTDYATAGIRPGAVNDFPDTAYSAAEIRRIIDRQNANGWSYCQNVRFVERNGGRLVTTPNGMLMGLAGNRVLGLFSAQGGTVWGDVFLVNIRSADPAEQLRLIVRSGHAWYADDHGRPFESGLALDRVLHHEERHSRQWAARGRRRMLTDYGWELFRQRVLRKTNRLEEDAGLSDGGYC
jgi:hypothetical protein